MTQLLIAYPSLRWLLLLLLFGAVSLATYAVMALTGGRGAARQRLAGDGPILAPTSGGSVIASTLRTDNPEIEKCLFVVGRYHWTALN